MNQPYQFHFNKVMGICTVYPQYIGFTEDGSDTNGDIVTFCTGSFKLIILKHNQTFTQTNLIGYTLWKGKKQQDFKSSVFTFSFSALALQYCKSNLMTCSHKHRPCCHHVLAKGCIKFNALYYCKYHSRFLYFLLIFQMHQFHPCL